MFLENSDDSAFIESKSNLLLKKYKDVRTITQGNP